MMLQLIVGTNVKEFCFGGQVFSPGLYFADLSDVTWA